MICNIWAHLSDSLKKYVAEKRLIQGDMDGKCRRDRPAKTWYQDIKDWILPDMAAVSDRVDDQRRCNHSDNSESGST